MSDIHLTTQASLSLPRILAPVIMKKEKKRDRLSFEICWREGMEKERERELVSIFV